MLNWQNIGRQKAKIDNHHNDLCPTGCIERETHSCQFLVCKETQRQHQINFRNKFQQLQTYLVILVIILQILCYRLDTT